MNGDPSGTHASPADEPSWEATVAGTGSPPEVPGDEQPRRRAQARHRAAEEVVEEFDTRPDRRMQAWLAGSVAAVLLVVAGTAWGVVQALPGRPAPPPAAVPQRAPAAPIEGRNVVLVLTDTGGATVAAAVMGADAERATCVLTPRRLVLDVRGGRPTPLSSAFAASDSRGAAAVADTLGVKVDGAWRLSSKGLSSLVEAVGGVEVDTSVRVGPAGALVEGGAPESLGGPEAVEFVTRPPKDLAEDARLARFYAVLDGVLMALPDDDGARREALAGLGGETRSTLPRDQFLRFVGDLHTAAEGQDVEDRVLPVVPAGEGRPGGFDIDAARFEALLDGPLAHVKRPVKARVDAEGRSAGAAGEARARLEKARLAYEPASPTDATGATAAPGRPTTIAVGDSPAALRRAREVARALGLPPSSIVVERLRDAANDVLVRLGVDWERLLHAPGAGGVAPSATPS